MSHPISVLATCLLAALPLAAPAQQRAATPPAFKGVWEPVSFSEGINFREVFFVTADKGWVAGEQGTIIHTADGGTTWTAQLGGDPAAEEEPVKMLRFVDETHGWAVRAGRVLRTEDGESWEDLGAAPNFIQEIAMSSPTEGVAAGFIGAGTQPSSIFRTRDGGRTWKPVTTCSIKVMLAGLNRDVNCHVIRIQFVTPTVGYLVAHNNCGGNDCVPPPILGKTEDGGDSWRFFVGPGDVNVVGATDLFFTDENRGIVRTTDGKLALTADGGATWRGLTASVSSYAALNFADPEVGWALDEYKMSFTTDGGARWNSRSLTFPAHARAFSIPRRDRVYAVGDEGMVFRYRVIPASEAAPAATMTVPAMPAMESPLDEQIPEMEGFVQDLTVAVEQAPASPGSGTSAPFASSCCGDKVNRLDAVLSLVLESLPQFVARFKNTNLLTTGLLMLSTMPGQLGEVSGAYNEFKQAPNKEGAQAALARLVTALSSLRQSTLAAFQKETP
jgi:photosystem II stability/assembly factor-like uncharacterized protein